MSKRIAALLDEPERAVRKLVDRLEAKNGYPSNDVRHLAENIHKVRAKITGLGLDPDDTTAEELYQALLVKFQNDSRRFDEHFGVHLKSYDEKIARAAELVNGAIDLPEHWVLKVTSAKALLRQHPPKHVMKQLNYRSVSSLLKHQDAAGLYLAIGMFESAAWNTAHAKLVSSLDSTAFELRRLKVTALPASKWGPSPDVNVLFSNDYGSLGLAPAEAAEDSGLLALTVLLLDGVQRLTDIDLSEAAKLSPAAAWWADTDGLIASLAGGDVSIDLRDMTENHVFGLDFAARALDSARQAFWRQLQSRYQNRLLPEEDLLADVTKKIQLPAKPAFQPAFEFEEALDG